MINPFILRKYLALTLASMLPLMAFYVSSSYYGLYWGLGFMMLALLLGFFMATALLKHPFTIMIEGKGFLTLDMTSTGIIVPFITHLNPRQKKFLWGSFGGKTIEDIFDRNAVIQISEPIELREIKELNKIYPAMEEKDGVLTLRLDKKAYNSARFALQHFPVLIWNSQIESLLTKDFLSNNEKEMFTEHTILYLHQKVKQLIDTSTNFARHVVDTLKPKNQFLSSGWFWVLIIGVILVISIMLAPKIIAQFQGQLGSSITSALNQPIGRT